MRSMMARFRPRSQAKSSVLRLTTAGRLSAVILTALGAAGITSAVVRPAHPAVVRVSAAALARGDTPVLGGHWVGTWAAAPQLTEPGNMPPAPFTQDNLVFADSTVRQSIHVTVGGRLIRLRFSNAYGGTNHPIT